ncbi:F-box domain, cyclin-like protein [Artemisia annua]|uniref:F-box domain, cyclin-like protein n=1 Tax=Artemisia annua TaxID=35608 RepID=A0A2U1QM96_ARTAN|nr:F-box domain, cyclin-like protein [Artemisia annua]
MDLVHERASIAAEEEDRISKLPDDIIHHILSFLDMKYAVQTSAVSRKWKHIWTTMPYLNLDSQLFPKLPHFAKFVKQALCHRNNHTEVSAVDLKFTGAATKLTRIVNYAYSHNIRRMNVQWITKRSYEFPVYLFSSHTLKHLTIEVGYPYYSCVYGTCFYPELIWELPALETLNLSGVPFGFYEKKNINLFSESVNLKDLTLDRCSMYGFGIVTIGCSQLSNLTITNVCSYPELSVEAFNSLEKVNLCDSNYHVHKKRGFPRLLELFQKLSFVKVLTLDIDIVETLSSNLDQLSYEPCPFNNLKCLKINPPPQINTDPIPTIPSEVREYLLHNSPNATCNLNSPQLSRKRSRKKLLVVTMAKKVAKLEEKLQSRDEVIIEQKEKNTNVGGSKVAA